MLLKEFYEVRSLEKTGDGKYMAQITVNPAHDVFDGHFPDNPIMPGVCMMQIIKELVEQIAGSKLMMQSLSNVKFMALINPNVNPDLRLELDVISIDGLIKVKNSTYFDETTALKLSSTYKAAS